MITIRYPYDLEVALKELEDREEVLQSQLQNISQQRLNEEMGAKQDTRSLLVVEQQRVMKQWNMTDVGFEGIALEDGSNSSLGRSCRYPKYVSLSFLSSLFSLLSSLFSLLFSFFFYLLTSSNSSSGTTLIMANKCFGGALILSTFINYISIYYIVLNFD